MFLGRVDSHIFVKDVNRPFSLMGGRLGWGFSKDFVLKSILQSRDDYILAILLAFGAFLASFSVLSYLHGNAGLPSNARLLPTTDHHLQREKEKNQIISSRDFGLYVPSTTHDERTHGRIPRNCNRTALHSPPPKEYKKKKKNGSSKSNLIRRTAAISNAHPEHLFSVLASSTSFSSSYPLRADVSLHLPSTEPNLTALGRIPLVTRRRSGMIQAPEECSRSVSTLKSILNCPMCSPALFQSWFSLDLPLT